MYEVAIVVGVILVCLAVMLPGPAAGFVAGAVLVVVGLLVALPGGVGYHVYLRRGLIAGGGLPRGWIWRPTSLHGELSPDAKRPTMRWFYVGAAGWGITMLGCAFALVALIRTVALS